MLTDGIDHDAGTCAQFAFRAGQPRTANQDIQIHIAVVIQIPHGAGIWAAGFGFELGNDFHAADFRATGDRAAGKYGGDHLTRRYIVTQTTTDIRHDVMHMRITLYAHQLIHVHATGLADAAQIIALEINQHHVFGTFFRMADQFPNAMFVIVTRKTRARSCNRACLHVAAMTRH